MREPEVVSPEISIKFMKPQQNNEEKRKQKKKNSLLMLRIKAKPPTTYLIDVKITSGMLKNSMPINLKSKWKNKYSKRHTQPTPIQEEWIT